MSTFVIEDTSERPAHITERLETVRLYGPFDDEYAALEWVADKAAGAPSWVRWTLAPPRGTGQRFTIGVATVWWRGKHGD